MHGALSIYGFLELTTSRAMHRDLVIVLSTLSKYITLFLAGLLIVGLFNGGSVDKYLNLLFEVMFIYLGPWALLSASLEYYYDDELVITTQKK